MGTFATKRFSRFARKVGLAQAKLVEAAAEVVAGRFDADLGGSVFKKRVARDGAGKSGGFRTIILFRQGGHCFFAYGFAKNQKATVSAKELEVVKRWAVLLLGYSEAEIAEALRSGELTEVSDGDEA